MQQFMTASYDKNPCRKGNVNNFIRGLLAQYHVTKYSFLICLLDGEKHLKDLN